MVYVGQAGWSVPKGVASHFGTEGSHLNRYAGTLNGVEINTTFYRPHKPETFERWAASVPAGFRFAVKAPREITHFRRLRDVDAVLDEFLEQTAHLGDRRGPLLFQLPPAFAFDEDTLEAFLATLRERHDGPVAWEPRHPSWFAPQPEVVLTRYRVARVAADPARVPAAALPAGYPGLVYFRWHGSPRMYYSAYSAEAIASLAERASSASHAAEVWCIFDNTAAFAATGNALMLRHALRQQAGHLP